MGVQVKAWGNASVTQQIDLIAKALWIQCQFHIPFCPREPEA